MEPRPGEVYLIPDPVRKRRRVIVVSRDELNRGGYVLAVPVTSSRYEVRSKLPNCVSFVPGECGMDERCVAQCEMLGAVEVGDLIEGPVAVLGDDRMREVTKSIGYAIRADCEPM